MRSSSHLFVVFILILTAGLMQVNYMFRDYFSDAKDLEKSLVASEKNVQLEKLKIAVLNNQLEDLQTNVTAILPQLDRNQVAGKSYALRTLSQSLRNPASQEPIDLSSVILARGKEHFVKQEFSKAARNFQDAIDKYPGSGNTIEAHFLLAESYFLNGQHDESLEVIYQMMEQFPEHEMTGYIMLRMGLIFQQRKRLAEAAEVYKIIIDNFKNSEGLKIQAQKLLKSTEA